MSSPESIAQPASASQSEPQVNARTIFQSSPIQLRAAALLYGVASVPLAQARVLELGCGAAENLLPFALAYPEARVVGVDASSEDLAKGQAAARKLGAENLQLHVMGALDLDASLGQFDYIILHQAYSKVPSEIGRALLAICRQHLAPQGIAFVSYHTLPGWKVADLVRDAMLLGGHAALDLAENVVAARTAITLMSDSMAAANPLTPALAPVLEYARGLPDDELAAEFLHGAASPCYFIEFANTAVQSDLIHVGDAEPEQEIPLTHGYNVALYNSVIGLGQQAVVRQQYLDFAVGRHFRHSMLVHRERAQECLPVPDLSRLESLRCAGCFKRRAPRPGTNDAWHTYVNQVERTIVTDDAHVRAIMAALTAVWPASLDMHDLLRVMPEHAFEEESVVRKEVQRALETLLRARMLRLSKDETTYDTDTGRAISLTSQFRLALSEQPEGGRFSTWSLWHEPVNLELSAAEVRFLAQVDGTTPAQSWHDGVNTGAAVAGSEPDWASIDIVKLMERLRGMGLISGSSGAWVDYFQTLLVRSGCQDENWPAQLDALIAHSERWAATGAALNTPAPATTARQGLTAVWELQSQQRYEEAELAVRELLREYPNTRAGWHGLSRILIDLNRGEEAVTALCRAIVLSPLDATLHAELGKLLYERNEVELAETCAARTIRIKTDEPVSYNALGIVLRECGRLEAARRCLEYSVKLDPNRADTHNILGILLSELGFLADAEASYRRSLSIDPNDFLTRSNLVFLLTHRIDMSPADILREHQAFGVRATRRASGLARPRLANSRKPERALRVGFVSGDLRNHAVMNFLEPVWRNLDRDAFHIYAYHTVDAEDANTDRVRGLARSWRRVKQLSDAQLSKCIRDDGIDILFDLSGHTNWNRLPMFAMRAAPVQISWIGYPATTGLAEMDYYLIDRHVAPPGLLDDQFSEKLIYLPSAVTFEPFPGSPPVNTAPALRNGYITFASFNRYNKISDPVLALWSRVLARLPDSKILMGSIPETSKAELTERFTRFGVSADRILFRPRAPMHQYLAYHHEADIALDTFPYTGGTTTFHSLWMGVPVLTMSGRTRVERQTAGALGQAGLEDWICNTQDEFVDKAENWARDLSRLVALRAVLRHQLLKAPGLNAAYVAQGLGRAMREMWHIWCRGETAKSFSVEP